MESLRTELQDIEMPDSPSTSRDRVLRLVEQIAGHPVEIVDDIEPEPDAEYGCDECSGSGWLLPDVPRSHPDFGKAYPCRCMEPLIRRQQVERIFGAAKVPPEYDGASFATYRELPLSGQQILAAEMVGAWSEAGQRSILLTGKVGLGKTGLAVAAMRRRVELHRVDALFVTTIDLLDAIRGTYSEGAAISESAVLDGVRKVSLLVLDDIGRERIQEGARGDWVRERLFAIVNHRQINHLATIYTSNKDIAELGDHLGEATAWRIKAACWPNVIQMAGTNLRDL